MDKLGQAERIIADIRIGADRLLEALFIAAAQPHQGNKHLQLFLKEDACMRQYLQDLRSLGTCANPVCFPYILVAIRVLDSAVSF